MVELLLKRRTAVAWTEGADELEQTLTRLLADLGVWLRDDPAVQRTLNTAARALARRVLAPRRHEIGRFIAQVVAGWDTRSVVDRLELQVGPDLQYIRVNGTIVGGVVGLSLFASYAGFSDYPDERGAPTAQGCANVTILSYA